MHIHIRALDALRQTAGKLPINIKVLIEGEEEVGSESLWDYVQQNKAKLKADALVVSDTGDAGARRAVDHLRAARPELLRDRNHRAGAGFAFGHLWRRGAQSADDPQRSCSPSCTTRISA